jgi:hypothetical protein
MKDTNQEIPQTEESEIDDRALQLWEQAGCPAGKEGHFWLLAEEEIVNRKKAETDWHPGDH